MLEDRLYLQMQHARKFPVKTVDLEENDSFRARVSHVLKGRSLREFVAEIGLGPMQAMGMSAQEIENFTEVAETRLIDDPDAPSVWNRANKIPAHFTIDE